jgi:hypothetical protein
MHVQTIPFKTLKNKPIIKHLHQSYGTQVTPIKMIDFYTIIRQNQTPLSKKRGKIRFVSLQFPNFHTTHFPQHVVFTFFPQNSYKLKKKISVPEFLCLGHFENRKMEAMALREGMDGRDLMKP